MNMLNQCIIEGLIKSFDIKETLAGVKTCNFVVDVPRYYKDGQGHEHEEHSQFDCVCFERMAEVTYEQSKVGRGVRVVGRLKQEVWHDADDLQHSKVFIICEHIEFKPYR